MIHPFWTLFPNRCCLRPTLLRLNNLGGVISWLCSSSGKDPCSGCLRYCAFRKQKFRSVGIRFRSQYLNFSQTHPVARHQISALEWSLAYGVENGNEACFNYTRRYANPSIACVHFQESMHSKTELLSIHTTSSNSSHYRANIVF